VTLKIFLVEDNVKIRKILTETLQDLAGAQVVGTAGTSVEAMSWLNRAPREWDVAIVDVFLHEWSGLSVLQALRARTDAHKAVVLSNYSSPELRKQCLALGADAVLDKSNDIPTLLQFCLDLQGDAKTSP